MAGVAVLFWGGLSGNHLLGLFFAILLEAKNWIKIRWDFDEKGHVKAYQASLLFLLIGLVLIWIDGEGRYGMLKIMQWMPLYALPVELAQRYGRQQSMYLNTFFYFSRKRMIQDRIEGRDIEPMRINTGYPYIGLVLLATACSAEASWTHVIGLIVLIMAVLISVSWKRGMGYWGAVMVAPVMVVLGLTIQWGVVSLNNYLRNPQASGQDAVGGGRNDMNEFRADIGALGKVKQSKEVMWRVWTDMDPRYLRMGTYDTYHDGVWTYSFRTDGYKDSVEAFEREGSITVGSVDDLAEVYRREDEERGASLNPAQGARIRGTIDDKSSTAVVPAIPGYYAVSKILGDKVNSDNNPMGTLRLVNREPIIDYKLWAEPGNNVQDIAPRSKDLLVSPRDRPLIKEVAEKLKLASYPTTEQKIAAIRNYFTTEFTYATHFDVDYDRFSKTELEIFLKDIKKGHCEYFASATVLLLRQAGVPARYAVGYAVSEKEDGVWLVRGTHGHAWCRVYVDGQWKDVDLTPPGWLEADSSMVKMNALARFQEWLKLLREDFQVWRQDESNKGKFWMIMSGIGLLLGGWFGFRLWRSRLSLDADSSKYLWNGERVDTPLYQLEKAAAKVLGARPVGMPYGKWISGLSSIDGVDEAELDRAVALHQRLRFDPEADIDPSELAGLTEKVRSAIKRAPQRQ